MKIAQLPQNHLKSPMVVVVVVVVVVVTKTKTKLSLPQGCIYEMKGLNGPKLMEAVKRAVDDLSVEPEAVEFLGQQIMSCATTSHVMCHN
jgi:hypothetical protein